MTDIDTSQYRARLLEEQERLMQAVDFLERENPGSISDELGDIVTSGDDNLGDTAPRRTNASSTRASRKGRSRR